MQPTSTIPSIRTDNPDFENHIVMWMEKFGRQIQATRDLPDCELLFAGDSITEHWPYEDYAADIWEEYYGIRKVINAGSGGDCTEHILWRLENGIMEHIRPALVVLLAGTNNTGRRMEPPEDICAGIQAIIDCVLRYSPNSKILLHAIFPRGHDANDPERQINEAASPLLKHLADTYAQVEFLNINDVFLGADEILSEDIMPDLLHPGREGYRLWAEAIEPYVANVLR